MEFYEALRALGVGVEAGSEGARRAYLRLLRKHNPERDQEGFLRLREAYEIVRSQIEWRSAMAASRSGGASGANELVEPREEHTGFGEASTPAAQPATRPGEPAPAAADLEGLGERIVRFYEALDEIPLEDGERRLDVARRAATELPGRAEPLWLLYDELVGAGRPGEALEVLRQGRDAGMDGFEAQMLGAHAAQLDGRDLDRARRATSTRAQMALAEALASRGEVRGAAKLVRSAVRGADEADLEEISPSVALRVALVAFSKDLVVTGQKLVPHIRRLVRRRERQGLVLPQHQAALFVVTAELARLPETFPDPLRRAIASAVLAGNLDAAGPAMTVFAMERPSETREAAAQLAARAPSLHAAYREILAGRVGRLRATVQGSAGRFPTWLITLGLFAVCQCARLFGGPSCGTSRVASTGDRGVSSAAFDQVEPTVIPPPPVEVWDGPDPSGRGPCADRSSELCRFGQDVTRALGIWDCATAWRALDEGELALSVRQRDEESPEFETRLRELRLSVWRRCGRRPREQGSPTTARSRGGGSER